jgi:hypothetical protein
VGADATSFDLTSKDVFCEHIIQISTAGAATVSDPVTVLKSPIDVGLYTTSGYPTNSAAQGDSIVIRFSAPSDWDGVTDVQSYSVSTVPTGVTFINNPCEFTPNVTEICQVTANVAASVATNGYSFVITQEPGTVINTDFSSSAYDVTEPSYAFVSNWQNGVNTVSRCNVDPGGIFSDCSDTGGTNFNKPFGVTLNPAGNLAFVLNFGGISITTCNLDF